MTRTQLFGIWLLCVISSPILLVVMLLQVILGNHHRVLSMFISFDECGNDAMGGTIGMTISAQVGNALKRGRQWAKVAAFIIDGLLGQGHCLSKATI